MSEGGLLYAYKAGTSMANLIARKDSRAANDEEARLKLPRRGSTASPDLIIIANHLSARPASRAIAASNSLNSTGLAMNIW
jgi:hypothetical protein